MDQDTIDVIVQYYVNLLIIQYSNLPRAAATVALYINEFLASGVIFDVRDGYAIDTAVGHQLDILAKYIGIDRFYTGQDLQGYFSFAVYSDDPVYVASEKTGFADYTDVGVKVGKYLTYDDVLSVTYSLNDADFRTLMKLKILQNNCNESDKEIDDGIFELFADKLIPVDNYDMTMTYIVSPEISALISVAASKEILPKPMGVELILQDSTA